MENKALFEASPSSYSHFVESKKQNIHRLMPQEDPLISAEFFKHSISVHYKCLYKAQKWQNWIYRLIFFGFGLLFLILGIIIFLKTVNFAFGFYINNCVLVKNCINIFCLLLSGGAFLVGYCIHPEKEAVHYLMSKVERELNATRYFQTEFILKRIQSWN